MKTKIKERLKGIFIAPLGLSLILVPFSLLLGWNLLTLFLFWFILTPALAYFLPKRVSNNANHLIESIIGLVIFYSLMIFMIYDLHATDFFLIMIISFLVNSILITLLSLVSKTKTQIQ